MGINAVFTRLPLAACIRAIARRRVLVRGCRLSHYCSVKLQIVSLPQFMRSCSVPIACSLFTHIASTLLSSFMHQVVAPPINAHSLQPGRHDAVTSRHLLSRLPDRIMYRLFIIKSHVNMDGNATQHAKPSSGSHTSHAPFDPLTAGVNIPAIRRALQAAALPGQDVFLAVQKCVECSLRVWRALCDRVCLHRSICIDDDDVLATALAASMRHDYETSLSPSGKLESRYAPYIDSAALGSLLQVAVELCTVLSQC